MLKLNNLMQKEMTRKEFLATLGFGAATVMGFSTILELLGKNNPLKHNTASLHGYGNGAYGGKASNAH